MRLVLLGPPGSGKGTQAVGLAVSLGVPHIATGDLFRAEIAEHTPLGILADEYISRGNLVPDEIVNQMMDERLSRDDAEGFLLDGYPRTLEQGRSLKIYLREVNRDLQIALALQVPDEAIVERAVGRLVCATCGSIYHLTNKPPRQMGVCDLDRGILKTRDDDKPSTVRHRLSVYHRLTAPLLKFYRQQDLLREVNGVGKPDEIAGRLRAAVESLC